MDYTKDLYELCDTISEAISEANEKIRSGGGKLSAGDVDYVDKLTHSLKSVKAVIAMEDDGYSGRKSYDDGRSYGRRRDMGRYSSRYYGDHSRDGGMVGELRELMMDAPDERTKAEFKRFISKIESM